MTPDEAWLDLCEVTDRTSPSDTPDMCLIKQEELTGYMASSYSKGVRDGIRQAAETLRLGARENRRLVETESKVAAICGFSSAARVLESYANGLDMDADRVEWEAL